MVLTPPESTYQSELKDWLTRFHSENGLPEKAVTFTIPERSLIVQYEPTGGTPNVARMRQTGQEMVMASGAGAVVAGGMAMLIGRTLLGNVAGRVGIAGAFGAIGLAPLLPAVLIGGTVGGVLYTAYKIGKNRSENERAEAYGAELLDHLSMFSPNNPKPSDLTIVVSEDRRITIICDPELEAA